MADNRKKLIEKIIENIYSIRRKVSAEMHNLFNDMQITHSQWIVLHFIKKKENIKMKDLASLLDITGSAATQIVDGLVRKGFILRKREINDRRILKITLTDKAKSQFDSIKRKSFNALYGLFDALDDEELLNFFKISNKMVEGNLTMTQPRSQNRPQSQPQSQHKSHDGKDKN